MPTYIGVNNDSGNSLLSDDTKLLPETMLNYSQRDLLAFSWGQCHRNCSRYHSLQKCLKLHIWKYHQTSNISHTLEVNTIVYHSDVAEVSPVGAAPTTSSFSTQHMASMNWEKTTARSDEKIQVLGFGVLILEVWWYCYISGCQLDKSQTWTIQQVLSR